MSAAELPARRSRRIALLKPQQELGDQVAHALQLFDSMLWVFRGTTQANWILCSAADAEVIVLHATHDQRPVDEWRKQGKVIVTLSNDPSAAKQSEHALVYPFPAATVLKLLEGIDEQLAGVTRARTPATPAREGSGNSFDFIEAIRTVRAARNAELWMAVADGSERVLWLRGDGAEYRASAEVRTGLRCGVLQVRHFSSEKVAGPPAGLTTGSGEEIAWFSGYYSGGTLAPWLSETERYRLRRWPDFGLLRAPDGLTMACQLRVLAALDAAPATPASLVVRARVTRMQTARVLNALSTTGLIEVDTAASAAPARTEFAAARPEGGFRQFFREIRKHLQRRSGT